MVRAGATQIARDTLKHDFPERLQVIFRHPASQREHMLAEYRVLIEPFQHRLDARRVELANIARFE